MSGQHKFVPVSVCGECGLDVVDGDHWLRCGHLEGYYNDHHCELEFGHDGPHQMVRTPSLLEFLPLEPPEHTVPPRYRGVEGSMPGLWGQREVGR